LLKRGLGYLVESGGTPGWGLGLEEWMT